MSGRDDTYAPPASFGQGQTVPETFEAAPLVPDAILPPGVSPEEPSPEAGQVEENQPAAEPEVAQTPPQGVPIPPRDTLVFPPPEAESPVAAATVTDLARGPFQPLPSPPDPAPPPSPPAGGGSGKRRGLLIGGIILGVLVLGAGAAFGLGKVPGSAHHRKAAKPAAPPAPPKATVTVTARPKPSTPKVKVDIRDEKTDPRPLDIGEVFPDKAVNLDGHAFARAKSSLNEHCELAARGSFAQALVHQRCRRVVRATFMDAQHRFAVTTGIAVMPTDAAAAAVQQAQNPGKLQWFSGMAAPGATKIDQAGGYAASTLRGRYIIYAHATYADGHQPKPNDPALRAIGDAFRGYTTGPIDRRARS